LGSVLIKITVSSGRKIKKNENRDPRKKYFSFVKKEKRTDVCYFFARFFFFLILFHICTANKPATILLRIKRVRKNNTTEWIFCICFWEKGKS